MLRVQVLVEKTAINGRKTEGIEFVNLDTGFPTVSGYSVFAEKVRSAIETDYWKLKTIYSWSIFAKEKTKPCRKKLSELQLPPALSQIIKNDSDMD